MSFRFDISTAVPRAIVLSGCVLLLLLSTSQVAFAQEGGNVIANGASAGALITAVMEQVGYNSQARILTDLSEHLSWLGALIYLGVIASMVLTVALSGNYRAALWSLVGPALFFYASGLEFAGQKNTIAGAGVEWRFGAFDDTKVEGSKKAIMSRPDVNPQGDVSFLFHKYNELVSEIIQKGIKIITDEDMRKQMRFMSRQRVMEELFGESIVNPDIKALVGYFMVHCTEEISYARMIALGNRDPDFRKDPDYEMAKNEYCRLFGESNKPFVPGPWQDYVYDAGLWNGTNVTKEQHDSNHERDYGVVSCAQMWNWVKDGSKKEILKSIADLSILTVPSEAWKIYGNSIYLAALKAVKEKLTTSKNVEQHRVESPGDPCPEASGSEAAGETTGDDMEVLSSIFAGYLVRQNLMSPPSAEIMSRVQSGDHGFTGSNKVAFNISNPNAKQDVVRRQTAHQFSRARRYEAYMLLSLMPYLQGILLYVLSVTYPFFTVLLILPGQAGSFFMWMALWVWAKSWDLGWAMIIVADDVIWQLMPKTAFINPDNQAPYSSPISLLEAAFDGDHSYTIATYWLLLSTMISGVPVVTAQAVLGSKKAIAGVMLKGFSDFTDQFSSGSQDYVATGQVRGYTMAAERDASAQIAASSMAEFAKSTADSNTIMDALKGAIFGETFTGLFKTTASKNAQQDFSSAVSEFLVAEQLHKGGAITQKRLDAAQAKLTAAGIKQGMEGEKLEKYLNGERLKQEQRGVAMTAGIIGNLPAGKEEMEKLLGIGMDISMWKSNQTMELILEALGKSGDEKAEDQTIGNDGLREEFEQQKVVEWLAQVNGYSKQDFGEAVAVLGGAYAGGSGYAIGGPAGAHNMFMRMVDAGSASNMANYQYQYKVAEMQMQRQDVFNQWAAYSMNKNPLWLNRDYARAHVSSNRTEWFFHSQAPLNSYWQFQQIRESSEAYFRNIDGQERGAHSRLMLDLGPNAWGNARSK